MTKRDVLFLAVSALAVSVSAVCHAQDRQAPGNDNVVGSTEDRDSPPADDAGAGQDITVTATRTQSGYLAPTPTTVIGDQLDVRAAPNVIDVINEVPAFRPTQTQASSSIRGDGYGGSTPDLRGLNSLTGTATARTLVLVDGRRVVPNSPAGLVDINLLPNSLVKRVEVVTGGASADWGSDAVAGVVNLILDKDLEGLKANVSYGVAEAGDYNGLNASIAGGTSLAGGNAHLIFGAEYSNNEGIGDVYSARRWSADSCRVFARGNNRPAGIPANTISCGVRFSDRLTPGGIIVGGPLDNTVFLPGGGTRPFQPGDVVSGILMLGGDNERSSTVSGANIINPVERYSALARLEVNVTKDVTGYVEASFANSDFHGNGAQFRNTGNLTIYRENPFLPESVAEQMDTLGLTSFKFGRVLTERQKTYGATQDVKRLRVGADGPLGGSWKWSAYASYGQNKTKERDLNFLSSNFYAAIDAIPGPGGTPICNPDYRGPTADQPDPGCVPLNPFGEGSPSTGSLDYISGTIAYDVLLEQQDAAFDITGEPFAIADDPVAVAAGVEYRRDTFRANSDVNSALSRFDSANPQPAQGGYRVFEGYLEAEVPLIQHTPGFENLLLNGAVRVTNYSTSGTVATWKAGAVYDPISGITFRATRSRDIRAPNLFELYGGQFTTTATLRLPATGTEDQLRIITGSNPDLKPERADTFTAGIVLKPAFARGFQASADYYTIDVDDVIAQLDAQLVLDRCNQGLSAYCEDIVAISPSDVEQVFNGQRNFARLKTSGWDFSANYRVPFDSIGIPGDLQLRGKATHVRHLLVNDGDQVIDRVKEFAPKWSWILGATYSISGFTADVQLQHIGKTIFDATLVGPDDPAYDPAASNSIDRNVIDPINYVNLSLHYQVNDRFQFYTIVNNLFDREPPVAAGKNSVGPSLYDLVGRAYRFGVRLNF